MWAGVLFDDRLGPDRVPELLLVEQFGQGFVALLGHAVSFSAQAGQAPNMMRTGRPCSSRCTCPVSRVVGQ
jgi:hypothetical protein